MNGLSQAWLRDCYNWIIENYGLDPHTNLDVIIRHVEHELLGSDLQDSMIPGTGVPQNTNTIRDGKLSGVLVQIVSIMEIGHSAFSLQNVRQARIERADLAGLNIEDGDDQEGSVPKYPRSMLRFQLSDGATVLEAIEYRRIPEFELGVTPLGYKVSFDMSWQSTVASCHSSPRVLSTSLCLLFISTMNMDNKIITCPQHRVSHCGLIY